MNSVLSLQLGLVRCFIAKKNEIWHNALYNPEKRTVRPPITCLFGFEKTATYEGSASYGRMRQAMGTCYDFRKLKSYQLIFLT